jgi:peptidyl-prolyl cis-trans isomerase SurA
MYIYGLRCGFSCFLLTVIVSISSQVWASYSDGVVATVGGEPILQSDIIQEIMPKIQSLSSDGVSEEELQRQIEPLFKEALEQAIEHFILYKEAQTLKVEVPEAEVEKRVAEFGKQYESPEAFQKTLGNAGFTMSDFRERMRRQMMAITVSMSKRRQFERDAVVSEKDIAQYYKDNEDKFHVPARYSVRRIFLQAPQDDAARQQVREKLNKMKEEVANGADFAGIAIKESQGPEAKEGGMMGWVRPGDLVEPLNSALASLPAGAISEPLETEFGIHLLRIEEVQSESTLPLAEARTEIEPVLRTTRGEERYRQWMNTLRKRNNVKVLM